MESEDVWRPLDLYQPNTIIFSSPSLHLYAVRRGYSDLLVMLYLLRIYWPAHVYIFIKYILINLSISWTIIQDITYEVWLDVTIQSSTVPKILHINKL